VLCTQYPFRYGHIADLGQTLNSSVTLSHLKVRGRMCRQRLWCTMSAAIPAVFLLWMCRSACWEVCHAVLLEMLLQAAKPAAIMLHGDLSYADDYQASI
jgi:hypothetical protein